MTGIEDGKDLWFAYLTRNQEIRSESEKALLATLHLFLRAFLFEINEAHTSYCEREICAASQDEEKINTCSMIYDYR
jgi:hypothetical protein